MLLWPPKSIPCVQSMLAPQRERVRLLSVESRHEHHSRLRHSPARDGADVTATALLRWKAALKGWTVTP